MRENCDPYFLNSPVIKFSVFCAVSHDKFLGLLQVYAQELALHSEAGLDLSWIARPVGHRSMPHLYE